MNSVRDWGPVSTFGPACCWILPSDAVAAMYCRHAHNVRGTLSQFAAWLESGCLRSDGKRDFRGGNDSPSKVLPGLEKDQNRRARLAMRCGLLLYL